MGDARFNLVKLMSLVLAIDIGGTRFRLGIFAPQGKKLSFFEGQTSRAGGREWMLEELRRSSRTLLAPYSSEVRACGISFGGPTDASEGCVTSVHVPGWQRFPLGQWVERELGLPCSVENDANAGALGEYHFGAGRGTHSLFYVTLSTGIGGGLILNGAVFHGADGLAGEIGHVPVLETWPLACCCGVTGCLESIASGTAIGRFAQERAAGRVSGPGAMDRIIELAGGQVENITAKAVLQAMAQGDEAGVSIAQIAAAALSRGLVAVIRLLSPDRIVLGGGVAQAGEPFLSLVRGSLSQFDTASFPARTPVVLAELGEDSPLYGAAWIGRALLAP